MAAVHVVDCSDAPIERVTVFSDRAEIKRKVAVELQPGSNEVGIRHINGNVLDDSVRVSGHGSAVIHEVKVEYRTATEKEKACPEALKLRDEVTNQEKAVALIEMKRNILTKKREALEQMINKMGTTGEKGLVDLSSVSFEGIESLLTYYETQVVTLHESDSGLKTELDELNEKLSVTRTELNKYLYPDAVKTVTVVLESAEGGAAELTLTYQLYGASWRPTYDVRVNTDDDNAEMQIAYYGGVQQSTGETWDGCQLVLSTARPCVGGNVPELGTLDVQLYQPPQEVVAAPVCYSYAESAPRMMMMECAQEDRLEMTYATSTVSEQALSTEFLIARPAAIPPDGSSHKVTIGVATVKPNLGHECVPSKDTNVFLTASATNTSDLPFLPGEASVFLDGNFISKTQLKAVSPGEHFTVSLGVDAAVRVDYKPAHQVQGEVGIINKNSTSVKQQLITVKNTKNEVVVVTVKEHVPRSTDEKIKVKLIHPPATTGTVSEGEARKLGAVINSSNNLEWTVAVDQQSKQELLVKYQIDFPGTEKLDFQEKF